MRSFVKVLRGVRGIDGEEQADDRLAAQVVALAFQTPKRVLNHTVRSRSERPSFAVGAVRRKAELPSTSGHDGLLVATF